ncbi:MAG: LuxR C-terminal-related transcriptional regulator [Jatrophihabitantaceae bacterium]
MSAPAGFGKTTLVAQWLASTADSVNATWLSLDSRDNNPALFWAYLVAAMNAAPLADGDAARSPLQPPNEAGIATLLNELGSRPGELVVVLDDYHVIDSRDVQDGVAFLLEHLPSQLHLVIASRADPALPVSRLRARGELVELRAAELRFTAEEAASYLNGVMGLALTAQDVQALEGRTEGWIAALQLAALSLQGRDDVAAFIAGFAGDDRYIVDYLAEEVLQRQPEDVRQFLLQTSLLDRLSAPLCDAVTGQDGGKAKLAALERGNLFLVALDDRRRWYRYHQLFANVLQAHLRDDQPDAVAGLHQRASRWYERNGEPAEAIGHALAAKDFERAADLVELAIPAMRRSRQEAAVHGWLDLLPDDLIGRRPVLAVAFAGALLAIGEFDGVEARLRDAERLLSTMPGASGEPQGLAAELVVVDRDELHRLPAMIELYRAAQALAQGDLLGTQQHAQRALDRSLPDEHLCLAAAAGLLGLAYWTSGDLEAGHRSYAECMAGLYRAGHVADTFGCAIALADIRLTQGRLSEAMRTYERALQLASTPDGRLLRGTADMHVGMSEVYRERDDLPAATRQLLHSQELGEHLGLPQNRYRWLVAMARVRQAEGELDAALSLLDEADRRYVGDFFPNVRPVSALRTRVHLLRGELAAALDWARENHLSARDDLSYLREFEHITLARVLLAQHAIVHDEQAMDEAIRLLARLLAAAEAGARTASVIEILLLQATAHQARDELPAALAALQRALTLAEPHGYVRIFADEGPPMASLLRAAAKHNAASSYLRQLLGAVSKHEDKPHPQLGLVERLSVRELAVLRLLGTDLNGPDIARELVVSLNTVRTHTKNIYTKLGVNDRRAAVRRAAELDLP